MKPGFPLMVVGMALLAALALGPACQEKTSQPAPASAAETAGPPASPAQAPGGGNGGWLEGIPPVVPVFAYGAMSSESYKAPVGKNPTFLLYYEGVTLEQAREYSGKLKAAGFEVTEDTSVRPGDFSAFGHLPQGEGRIGFNIGFQASGHVDLTITLIEKYE